MPPVLPPATHSVSANCGEIEEEPCETVVGATHNGGPFASDEAGEQSHTVVGAAPHSDVLALPTDSREIGQPSKAVRGTHNGVLDLPTNSSKIAEPSEAVFGSRWLLSSVVIL